MAKVLNQKGANGIIAEYQCAFALQRLLSAAGIQLRSSAAELQQLLVTKKAQFQSELTDDQMRRAIRQGDALAEYILQCIKSRPSALMLPQGFSCKAYECEIIPTGHLTIKADSSDVLINFYAKGERSPCFQCPISLKAYRGTTTSQGSKGGKAALTRLFLGKEKATDEEFFEAFGSDGRAFIAHLEKFKQVAKKFYANSDEGRAFILAYQARKGAGAKVNNPLRRKELGDYFEKITGELSEHVLARLYVSMFNEGFRKVRTRDELLAFSEAMKFVLGFDHEIVTLNAICLDEAPVVVENSVESGQHVRLREILGSLSDVRFNNKTKSSIISVDFVSPADKISLNLAIWKDGTIQFKMDSSQDE
jgi:hypothetical protein